MALIQRKIKLSQQEKDYIIFNIKENTQKLREVLYLFLGNVYIRKPAHVIEIFQTLFENILKFDGDFEFILKTLQSMTKHNQNLVIDEIHEVL